jgi:hypothetical protein
VLERAHFQVEDGIPIDLATVIECSAGFGKGPQVSTSLVGTWHCFDMHI